MLVSGRQTNTETHAYFAAYTRVRNASGIGVGRGWEDFRHCFRGKS